MHAFRQLFLFLLCGLFFLSQSSCAFYERYSMPDSRLQKINPEGLSVYVLDAAHPLTRGWYISAPTFEQNAVSGFISRMAEIETLEVAMIRDRQDARESRNDILLYVRPQFAMGLPDTATMRIQSSQLEKVEVCEMNNVKTIGLPMLGCTGLLVLIFLITGD